MTVRTWTVEYAADGRQVVGEMSVDESIAGVRPGVLVCHEATGLTDHARHIARRLAENGLVTFALDYFGDGLPLPDHLAMERLRELVADPVRTREAGMAGLSVLLNDPRCDPDKVAAIGYCFGGCMALELARAGTPLACVVGFHSRLATELPANRNDITGKVLVNIGADDPWIRSDERDAFEAEMRTAHADWQMNLYGGARHSFTNPAADGSINPGIVFDEKSNRRSWIAMSQLFDEALA